MNKQETQNLVRRFNGALAKDAMYIEIAGLAYSVSDNVDPEKDLVGFWNLELESPDDEPENPDEPYNDWLIKVEVICDLETDSFSTFILLAPETVADFIEGRWENPDAM